MDETKQAEFKIEVANPDDPVFYYCPACSHRFLTTVKMLLRGLRVNCDNCGSYITTNPHSTTPDILRRTLSGLGETLSSDVVLRRDGLWLFLDEAERAIIGTLDFDSDRAVALVFGSMVESRLERVILSRSQRNGKIEERLFQPSGALGSLSVKIDLAFLMGLISPEAHADLVNLKDIRNLFAHKTNSRDFESQQVRDKCRNFKLIDTRVEEVQPGQMVEVVNLSNPIPIIRIKFANQLKRQARDRYLLTAQIFNLQLVLGELKQFPLPLI